MTATALAVGRTLRIPRMSGTKLVFSWIGLALVAFPAAGYAGWGVSGHIDAVGPALIGGAITALASACSSGSSLEKIPA